MVSPAGLRHLWPCDEALLNSDKDQLTRKGKSIFVHKSC